MIDRKQVVALVRDQKLKRLRLSDSSGNILFDISCANEDEACDKLDEALNFFEHYGKLDVMGSKGTSGGDWKSATKWRVVYSKDNATSGPQQPQSMTGNFREMLQLFTLFQTMSGSNNNNQALLDERLKNMELQFQMKLKQFEFENEDPIKKYGPLAPYALSAMGKSTSEIKELMSLYQPATIRGPKLETDSAQSIKVMTVEEAKNLSDEHYQKEWERTLEDLAKKVLPEHLLVLLQILCEKPQVATKAIGLYQAGAF